MQYDSEEIFVVSEPHHVNYLKNINLEKVKIVAVSENIKRLLASRGITFESIDFSGNSDEKYIEWMKNLPYRAMKNRADIFKELSYNKFSFWWLMENWLFRGDGYFDSVRDVLDAVCIADGLIEKYKPNKIIFVDDRKLYSNVIKHIAGSNIVLSPISASRAFYLKKKLAGIASKYFWMYSFYLRRIASRKFSKCIGRGADALFIRGLAWERIYDYENNKTQFREPFTDELKKRLNGLSVGMQIGSHLNIKNMETCKSMCAMFENYWNHRAKKEHGLILKRVAEGFKRMMENDGFRKSFEFKGYDIWPLVENQFKRYFGVRLSSHARVFAMVSQMLDREKPKIVITPEEVSETARMVFFHCIKRRIPCVALQHGIFDTNLLCFHRKGEISSEKISPYLCPIPAKTCVYGQYYKDILVKKGNYPAQSVEVTGVQRFDRIFRQKFSKESFHRRHAIPFNKKIVAYITSPTSFNEEMTLALLNEIKKVKDAVVVIKHHPSENRKFYENIVKDADSNALVLSDADLYDVLNASDIVLTYLSTAGLEAMLFKKPLCVLNLTGEEDRIAYAKQGAAAGIYKKNEIVDIISKVLSKGALYKRIQRNAKLFIRRNAFKPDGRATDRIESIIKKLMK